MGKTGGRIALAVLAVVVAALVGAQSARLATYTVTNTGDSGAGSLRQAIGDANGNPGADTITFGIAGTGPHTIQPLTPLPGITGPTVLDGTTQSGYSSTPIIELDGSQAGASDGLAISASGPVTVKGLVVNRFTREGIQIAGTGAVTLLGNYIGTDVSGNAARPNGLRGVLINGGSGHTIGGVGEGGGNLISGNSNVGIGIFSGTNNTVLGNRIGTDAAGNSSVPNGPAGIQIYGGAAPFGADSNTIGGTAVGAGNVISGNTGPGIVLNSTGTSPSASNNTIQGNLIGTDASGNYDLGNSGVNGHGISLVNVGGIADNTIGGTGEGEANTIAYNAADGISIQSDAGNLRNEIRGNKIYSNGGLGIDLGANGSTPNDEPPDSDTGANNLQNFPVLNAGISSTTTVAGDLYSAPDLTYTIDVYAGTGCDTSTFGEGETHVASFPVTTDSPGGHASFSQSISIGGLTRLSATATDSSGNTSEFSSCVNVGGGGGGGGALTGSLSAIGGNVDLTALGTQEWALWGYERSGTSASLAPNARRSGGWVVSNLSDINPTGAPLRALGQFATQTPFTFNWSNGCGTTAATNAYAGLQHDGQPGSVGALNGGFSFTVPADTTSRTLRVYVSAHSATGRLTATLSDGSAPAYVDSGLTGPLNGANVPGVYTIAYAAASAGQTLTVEWIESVRPNPGADFSADNVALYAVALQGPSSDSGCPDLVVDSIVRGTPANPPHSYTVTVRNAGTRAADLSNVVVQGYYSADATIDGGDSPACGVTMSGTLAPAATRDVPVGCSAAPGEGDALLLVRVDAAFILPESSETNNVGSADLGTGGPAGAPVLFAAVPDATPGTLGVAGLIDTGTAEAGQLFDVSFYSVPQCDPSAPKTPLGIGAGFATNENGVAAFAKDGLTNVAAGTLVTATATPVGGSASPISNCVVADRNNTIWPTAFTLSANDTEAGRLRELGEGRWFKVPVLPNSRVQISLTGLPADYDLVVFSDIQAAYDRMVGGEAYDPEQGPNLALDDLNRAGAETPTDVFNTSQYNPSAWDPTNWEPDLNGSVFSPSQWSPSQWSPSQWSATQWSPSQWSPSQWSPSQWSPSQWSPSQWSPSQWSSSNPADPEAFTTAQTASILAVSGGTGTGDERVSVNTWNNTGFVYIRVQGKNGSFDAQQAFTLEVAREGNLCSGVADQASSPTAPAGDRRTLILVDSSRMTIPQTLSTKLTTLANRPDVKGAIVEVNADPTVGALNAQADGKPSCPYAKNLVASSVKRIVDAYRANNPIEHVVVVGADAVIPFFRYPDPALLGNETMYVPPVRDDTASQASLRLGYILNQDGYASSDSISLHGNLFPVPDLAIGRLIETPAEIEGMLDAYLGTAGGVVPTPTSSLVTGYDFLTDTADTIGEHFDAGLGGAANEELITDQTISPGVVSDGNDNAESYYRTRNWTGVDLRRELVNTGRDLVFLAGHFSANDALAADYKTNVLSTELAASSANFENAIVFSAGCHTGYNIVNGDATQWTEPLDWAQAFARKKATLISGTGYQYGDTDFLAHSERIYAEFARQLRITTTAGVAEPVAVGSALLRSKQIFLETTPGLTALDEKSLLQTTLFGLPMLSVNLPQGRIVETPDGSVVGGLTGVETGPGAELGLEFTDLGVGPGLASGQKQLKNTDGTNGPLATWLSGPDGVAVRPTQPILPLDSLNVTVPGTALRGVGFRSGSYTETPNVTPLTAAPATELRGVHAPFFTDVFFPTQPWTTNYFGALEGGSGATRLHATPVQHRSTSSATRRSFGNLDLRLFYNDNVSSYCAGTNPLALGPCPGDVAIAPALAAPPTITGVQTSYDGSVDELTFSARALGHLVAGIQSVWVTWTVPPGASGGAGSWQSLDLAVDDSDPTLWTGTLTGVTNAAAVHFVVQAVNGVGRVTIDDNVGAFYRHGSIPGPLDPGEDPPTPTTLAFTSGPPASVAYKQSFQVTVQLSSSAGCTVGGNVVRIGIGGGRLPTTTNDAGQATVALSAALTPGTYPVTASFAGTSTCGSSDASANVVVTKQATAMTLELSGPPGPTTPLVATLRTTTTPPVPLHQRTVFVVIQGPATRVFRGITDPQGRVIVPQSLLNALPTGNYTVRAHFNGVTLPGGVVIPADDLDYAGSSATLTLDRYPFGGFIGLANPPALNSAKGGSSVPIKFSFGTDLGLGVFASGFPKVGSINCATRAPIGTLSAAQNTGFRYDSENRHYTYDWKTTKGWTGCRQLVLRFADGTQHTLFFRF